MSPQTKKYLKLLLKIVVSVAAIYFVIRQIDVQATWEVVRSANILWLLLATLLFAGSKLIAAFRLQYYFRALDIYISHRDNIALYLLGMFYNLFLPGGIGGDGYKVWWLRQKFGKPVPGLIGALLLDRIHGVSALGFLALLGFIWVPFDFPGKLPLIIIALALLYPIYYIVIKRFFPRYSQIFVPASLLSFGVQLAQLLCVFCILNALGIKEELLAYGFIFLLSSIVAIIPFTIGGLGSREIVFFFGADILGLESGPSVVVSLIFYLITALVSFTGIYWMLKPGRLAIGKIDKRSPDV